MENRIIWAYYLADKFYRMIIFFGFAQKYSCDT